MSMADEYKIARSLLDSGPDIGVQDWMLFFMQLTKDGGESVFKGCSFDPKTEVLRLTDGERSAIYKVVEQRGEWVRLRWPD